jgi:hypothetical protein
MVWFVLGHNTRKNTQKRLLGRLHFEMLLFYPGLELAMQMTMYVMALGHRRS